MTMLDDEAVPSRPKGRQWHSGIGGFLLRDWPYILMLVLSLAGVAYTSFTQTGLYWVLLTPFIGLVCVITRWPEVEGREEHVHLVVSQALHWGAVLVAMELMSLQVLRQVTGIAGPLSVLTLLALGTFTAGLHIRSWKVCAVGVLLAVSVPAAAFLQQSALLILLVVAVLVAIAVPFFWTRSRLPVAPAQPADDVPVPGYEPAVAATTAAPLSPRPMFAPQAATPPMPQPPQPPLTEPEVSASPVAAVAVAEHPKPEPADQEPRPDNVRSISGGR